MIIINEFPLDAQLLIRYLNNNFSYQELAQEIGVSKEAIRKRLDKVREYLGQYDRPGQEEKTNSLFLEKENKRLQEDLQKKDGIIKILQLQLIIHRLTIIVLSCFKSKILKFFPSFKVTRFGADEKLFIINLWFKFEKLGGSFKDFCLHLGRSPRTVENWINKYKEKGLSGLYDKTTRPKHFGNKITKKIRDYLIGLFFRFPRWTPYQYHRYLRFHPETSYYVSLPVIQKLKAMHIERSNEEKERIKKRWAFNTGTDVWTMDFTSIIKTDAYELKLLTVSDHRSRFLFPTSLFLMTSTELVMNQLQELFLKYGKPSIIKVDNGPEFRMECREKLKELSIYLLNSPVNYGQFNGAHERIHLTLKKFITSFNSHGNLTRLVEEIASFEKEYNYEMKSEYLEDKTPADVYFNDKSFVPQKVEVVTPYEKDGSIKINFTNREGNHGQLSMPVIKCSS